MKAVVQQALFCQFVDVRRWNQTAERPGPAEAKIIDQNHQYVRCACRGLWWLREVRLRVLVRLAYHSRKRSRRQWKLIACCSDLGLGRCRKHSGQHRDRYNWCVEPKFRTAGSQYHLHSSARLRVAQDMEHNFTRNFAPTNPFLLTGDRDERVNL